MAEIRPDRRYTKTHEWIKMDGDVAVVGITDFAQEQLQDIVFAELPEVGQHVAAEEACAAVHSSKAVADVMAPLAGEVVDINGPLDERPELANEQPFDDGWLFKLRPDDAAATASLMDAEAYRAHCEAEEH